MNKYLKIAEAPWDCTNWKFTCLAGILKRKSMFHVKLLRIVKSNTGPTFEFQLQQYLDCTNQFNKFKTLHLCLQSKTER